MRRLFCAGALVFGLFAGMEAFGQSSNASLGGIVSDATNALIPGVTVTATNVDTGVATVGISNESGAYSIQGLLPGTYKVSASLPGFQVRTFTDLRLGNAIQARLNFTLEPATLNTTVEVSFSAERLLVDSASSVGTVLPDEAVRA